MDVLLRGGPLDGRARDGHPPCLTIWPGEGYPPGKYHIAGHPNADGRMPFDWAPSHPADPQGGRLT